MRALGAEIRLMESVKGYTNIVTIEDYHVVALPEGPRWVVLIRMELLTPLLQYVKDHPLDEAGVIKLGTDLCSALVVCRNKSIVHRDIKPENIFINRDGDFKLGDFGVARTLERVSTQFTRVGTYDYMAPEIYNNSIDAADIDSAAKVDIYSLGMVLYTRLNNGRLPFVDPDALPDPNARNAALISRMGGAALPEPRNGSPALKQIALKACAFDPNQRFQSAAEMRQALIDLQSNPRPLPPGRSPRSRSGRSRPQRADRS